MKYVQQNYSFQVQEMQLKKLSWKFLVIRVNNLSVHNTTVSKSLCKIFDYTRETIFSYGQLIWTNIINESLINIDGRGRYNTK